jgi:hypothetical protein
VIAHYSNPSDNPDEAKFRHESGDLAGDGSRINLLDPDIEANKQLRAIPCHS